MTRTLFIPIALAAASLLLANAASASPPTTAEMPGDYSQTFTGADSPCGFDITFSAAGTVTVTKRVIAQFTRIPRPSPLKALDELTEREREILLLIADGLSNAEIGQQLYISDTTVKTHITHILQKLNLRDRVQAVVLAYRTGLVA